MANTQVFFYAKTTVSQVKTTSNTNKLIRYHQITTNTDIQLHYTVNHDETSSWSTKTKFNTIPITKIYFGHEQRNTDQTDQ